MLASFPAEFVSKLHTGKVTALGTSQPSSSLAELEDYVAQTFPLIQVIGLRLAKIPSHENLLTGYVRGLATAARVVWPDWYGAHVEAGKKRIIPKSVSHLWVEKAQLLASTGSLPLPPGYQHAVHLEQLALALGAPELIISIAMSENTITEGRAKSLVSATTWLAQNAHAKVALLVAPSDLLSDEFNRVSKESLQQLDITSLPDLSDEELPAVTVTSVVGRPNPTSPGEVLLAERLSKDSALTGLFAYNQTIKSIYDKKFRVDLVWPEGKLVVEVDGYTFHNSKFAFGQDRHRDYELLISGYRVLRLTNEEIMKDSLKSLAKIRDSVDYIKKNLVRGA